MLKPVADGVDATLALARASNEAAADPERAGGLDIGRYTSLLRLEQDEKLSATQAKAVLADMLESGGEPAEIARRMGFEALEDDALSTLVAEIVDAHADEWARYRDGDDKLVGFFTGLVMRATNGRANGKAVAAELRRLRG